MSNTTHATSSQAAAPITLTAKILGIDNTVTSAELFSHFCKQPWAMWLDSCDSDHVDSRFDIIAWQPLVTLTTHGENTEICHLTYSDTQQLSTCSHVVSKEYSKNIGPEACTETSTDDPLLLLKKLQAQLFSMPTHQHPTLPFLGGALGYFSYDLGRRFEQLPDLASQDIHLPDMAMGLYNQAIIFDKQSATFYLVCPENVRKNIEAQITHLLSLTNSNANSKEHFTLTSHWQANMDKASYIEKFDQVQAYLLSGDCYQINLAQRFSANYQGDEFDAYLALREANKAPFSAFIRLENAAVLSVSPERFLQLSQSKVQSKPIKGTMPRSSDKTQDAINAEILRHSPKDNAENLMIVDLLRNDISRSCQAGTVKVPELFAIESFPAVHHLVSTVEGTLSADKHATDLLRGAFPGGSITGAPKIRAMEIIEELEPHRRSVYCGSIGYISNCGNMDTSITIRTLICQQAETTTVESKNTVYCWAGGGLVADSTAISEYQETFDKVKCILPVLSSLNNK